MLLVTLYFGKKCFRSSRPDGLLVIAAVYMCLCAEMESAQELTAFVEVQWSSLFKTNVGTCPRGR